MGVADNARKLGLEQAVQYGNDPVFVHVRHIAPRQQCRYRGPCASVSPSRPGCKRLCPCRAGARPLDLDHRVERRLPGGKPEQNPYSEELNRVVAPATQIRPLEKFLVPAALNGTHGAYRAPPHLCLMRAKNDYEAALAAVSAGNDMDMESRAYINHLAQLVKEKKN